MSIIAEFRVQSPDLVLEDALATVPDMELNLIKEVGTDPDRPYLFFWAAGDDFETFEAAMADDVTVTDVQRYTGVEDRVLYRLRITEETEVVSYPVWVELGADQLDARYVDGWWHNRMRFPDRDALAAIEDWCNEVDVSFDLERIYTDRPNDDGADGLTGAQREVLRVAYETGYFEVPRRASMADIASRLDISEQAVSERLRRGHRKLVANQVATVERS